MTRYYPLELNLRGKPVLMVGGGRVAARKLPELLACGAKVTVVAPELSPETSRLLTAFTWINRAVVREDIAGKELVFACSDDPAMIFKPPLRIKHIFTGRAVS